VDIVTERIRKREDRIPPQQGKGQKSSESDGGKLTVCSLAAPAMGEECGNVADQVIKRVGINAPIVQLASGFHFFINSQGGA
jgi:hypothetical protein